MSIFTRRESEPAPPPPSPTPPPRSAAPPPKPAGGPSHDRTQIASGSKVVGEVSGSAELLIDGQVEGKIDLDSRVVVGPQGKVRGEIRARSVQIGGQVQGNVQGLERVEVLGAGRLEGDMAAPKVHIADGAFFSGKVEMGPVADAKARGPADKDKDKAAARPDPAATRKSDESGPRDSDLVGTPQPDAPQPGAPQPGAPDSPSKGGTGK